MKKDNVLEQAFTLVAQLGWSDFKITDLLEKDLDLDLIILKQRFRCKEDLLKEMLSYIDAQVFDLVGIAKDETSSLKECLFELIMIRLEVLSRYKETIHSLCNNFSNYSLSLYFLQEGFYSAYWMLEISGVDLNGIKGMMKSFVFFISYLLIIFKWLKGEIEDESEQMFFVNKMINKLIPYF